MYDELWRYNGTQLYNTLLGCVKELVKDTLAEQYRVTGSFYKMEHDYPATTDEEGLAREKSDALKALRAARHLVRAAHHLDWRKPSWKRESNKSCRQSNAREYGITLDTNQESRLGNCR